MEERRKEKKEKKKKKRNIKLCTKIMLTSAAIVQRKLQICHSYQLGSNVPQSSDQSYEF